MEYNLSILQTIAQKCRRDKKNYFVAFLDVKKAYDRVCRNTLWKKLHQYGIPAHFIEMLQAVYLNPQSVLVFQDVQTDPLKMEIGLRQGCVLSPILFSLFIADLARDLQASGLGIPIHDVIVGAMLFADDIMLAGDEHQLRQLMYRILKYSEKNKLEFSSEKSIIIPLRRDPIKIHDNNTWPIQVTPKPGGLGMYEGAKEVVSGKYLGMIFQKGYNPHMEHATNVLIKGRKYVGLVAHLLRRTNNPQYLVQRIWSMYVIPALLYGGEVMQITKKFLADLEVICKSIVR